MRVASYNQMLACNGQSLSAFLSVHIKHKLGHNKEIVPYTDIRRTIETVVQADADILGLSEVLGEDQRHALIDALKPHGYISFRVARGHGLNKANDDFVETLLASRLPTEPVFAPVFDVPPTFGFGGGMLGVFVPDANLNVIQTHLPLRLSATRDLFEEYVRKLWAEIERLCAERTDAKIVVMGDFNSRYHDFLRVHAEFSALTRLSPDVPTCSVAPVVRLFYRKDLDHILGRHVSARDAGVLQGSSDHKLVWADI